MWRLRLLLILAIVTFASVASASVSRRNLLRHDPRRDEALLGIVTAVAFGLRMVRERKQPPRHSLY